MRTIGAFLASIMLISLGVPADATTFKCRFVKDGADVGNPCPLDSNDANKKCQQSFGSLIAICGANQYLLGCEFTNPAANTAELMKGKATDAAAGLKELAEKPGFVAGALTGLSATANIAVGYTEKQGAPQLGAICGP